MLGVILLSLRLFFLPPLVSMSNLLSTRRHLSGDSGRCAHILYNPWVKYPTQYSRIDVLPPPITDLLYHDIRLKKTSTQMSRRYSTLASVNKIKKRRYPISGPCGCIDRYTFPHGGALCPIPYRSWRHHKGKEEDISHVRPPGLVRHLTRQRVERSISPSRTHATVKSPL